MNDDDLITLVKEQRTRFPMTTSVDEIISRGRAVRARRRIPGVAGALAVAAGAALAVTALIPSGHPGSPQPRTQLAAWTVAKQPDGTIDVTIRELRDPAGLQAKLRADGVPAVVSGLSGRPAACRSYPLNESLIKAIYQFRPTGFRSGDLAVLVIHPSAVPDGIGLSIAYVHSAGGVQALGVGLVHASQQCTGS
jgi:hypothetical protein